MYHSSTQRRHWTFRGEDELSRCRADANRRCRCRAAAGGKVPGAERGQRRAGPGGGPGTAASCALPQVPPSDPPPPLETAEELVLCKYYEKRLLDFCAAFKPAMPRSVVVSGPGPLPLLGAGLAAWYRLGAAQGPARGAFPSSREQGNECGPLSPAAGFPSLPGWIGPGLVR